MLSTPFTRSDVCWVIVVVSALSSRAAFAHSLPSAYTPHAASVSLHPCPTRAARFIGHFTSRAPLAVHLFVCTISCPHSACILDAISTNNESGSRFYFRTNAKAKSRTNLLFPVIGARSRALSEFGHTSSFCISHPRCCCFSFYWRLAQT